MQYEKLLYRRYLFQLVTIVCIALVIDEWYVAMSASKAAVVSGTLVGYIMMLIVIILGTVLDIPLHRTLVRTAYMFLRSFPHVSARQISVHAAVALWLRHCTTSRKVAGSRPDQVNECFSMYLILPAALDPGGQSASNINEYQKQKNNVSGEQRATGE
jgi:hypothetical protein